MWSIAVRAADTPEPDATTTLIRAPPIATGSTVRTTRRARPAGRPQSSVAPMEAGTSGNSGSASSAGQRSSVAETVATPFTDEMIDTRLLHDRTMSVGDKIGEDEQRA